MALPTIPDYALPRAAQLPESRVAWPVRAHRAAVLVHDMQKYFVRAFGPSNPALIQATGRMAALVRSAHSVGAPVIYSAQPAAQTPQQRGLLGDFWGHGIQHAADADIVEALTPHDQDVLLTKWRYSAFQRTGLESLLAELGRDQLVVCGIYAHIGIQATALEAFMCDIQAFVVGDAVADFSADHHASALTFTAQRCGRVLSTAEAVAELTAPTLELHQLSGGGAASAS